MEGRHGEVDAHDRSAEEKPRGQARSACQQLSVRYPRTAIGVDHASTVRNAKEEIEMKNDFRPTFFVAFVLLALWLAAPASAQNVRTERVQFPRGQTGTVIDGTIQGGQIVDYVLGAQAGQTMSIGMTTSNASSYFNVTAPGASAAMHIGSTKGNNFRTVIPSSGDYRVRVYLMRNAARRNERADYRLNLSITGG
jgi:hypothetical protein